MFGSPASSKDLNLPFSMSPLKQGKDESGLNDPRHQQQMTNGLLRYRSAPSSLFGEMCEDFLPHRSSSPEAETMLARFLSPDLRQQIGEKPSAAGGVLANGPQSSPQLLPTMDHGASETFRHQNGGFSSSASQMGYHASPPPQQHLTSHNSAAAALAESSYRVESSVAMNNDQVKSGANGSNLIRHSSSPAGLFSHLSVENGLDMMRNMEGFRPGSCSNGEATLCSGRLKGGQINFSSRQSSSSVLMSQIPEIGNEGLDDCTPGDRGLGHGDGNGRSYMPPGLPVSSWEDTSLFSDSFSGLKRPRDPPESPNGDIRNHFPVLSHHLSLPKSSSEMAAILQFQDAVPCKIRAKRGCATHPRSIAERVRRTRISERMRKLQELVPNMDKQTNTADMLDLAVEYIKDLQKQVKLIRAYRRARPSAPAPASRNRAARVTHCSRRIQNKSDPRASRCPFRL